MTDKLKKQLIAILIAAALAAATSYGLISQQTADSIKAQADQALSENQPAPPSAPHQPTPAPQQAPPAPAPQQAPPAPAPQNPPPAPQP